MIKKLSIFILTLLLVLTACQVRTASTIPMPLSNIESNSEDLIDTVIRNDWSAAQSKVNKIKIYYKRLTPILNSASVSKEIIDRLGSAVNDLETNVSIKNSFGSRMQANKISKLVPDIADYYISPIPTDISRLDYLGREINLNVENSDWTSASSNYNIAIGLWDRLKAMLSTTYTRDLNTFQNNIDKLKSAIYKKDSAETTNQANALLENVDLLEKDFTKQSKKQLNNSQ